MDTPNPIARRALLKPLVRRRAAPRWSARIREAVANIAEREIASQLAPELAEREREAREALPTGQRNDESAAMRWIEFLSVLLAARRISLQEYVYLAAYAADGVLNDHIDKAKYPELENLSTRMRAVEEAHGLRADECWPVGAGPSEYQALNRSWDSAAEQRFAETLAEVEGNAAEQLFRDDRAEFERLRERGRRSLFHKEDVAAALSDTVIRYESEARAAASVRSYTAAVTLIGAAAEGILLLRCLRSRRKAVSVAGALPRSKRPRQGSSPMEWTFDTLINVCLAAGWLPVIPTEYGLLRPDSLAHVLREMRNRIHPGRACQSRPWVETEVRDYDDADVVYTALRAALSGGTHLKG